MLKPPWEPNRHVKHRKFRPAWTPDEWRRMERMRMAGWSNRRIGSVLGRTTCAVQFAWWRYGPSPEYERVQAYLALVRTAIAKGLSLVNKDPGALDAINLKRAARGTKELEAMCK